MDKEKQPLIDTYHHLEPTLKIIVRLMAVHVHAFRQKDLVSCLSVLGIGDSAGRKLAPGAIRVMIRQLTDAGLVYRTAAGSACDDAVKVEAVTEMVLAGEFKSIAWAVLSVMSATEKSSSRKQDPFAAWLRKLQLTIFYFENSSDMERIWKDGREILLPEMIEYLPFIRLFYQPLRPDLLASLELDVRARTLQYVLAEAEAALQPMSEVMAYAVDFFSDHPDLLQKNPGILEIIMVHGPVDYRQTMLDCLEKTAPEIFFAWKGCLSFLAGDNKAARVFFEESRSFLRNRLGNQGIFPGNFPGFCYLLTLLKTRESKFYHAALELIDAAWMADEDFSVLFMSLRDLFTEEEDPERPLDEVVLNWFPIHIYPAISTMSFLQSLIVTWENKQAGEYRIDNLLILQQKACDAGYIWLGAEISALLAQLGVRVEENRELARQLHQQCGTVSMVGMVGTFGTADSTAEIAESVPEWRKTLDALRSMGEEVQLNAKTGDLLAQRLIWLLDCYTGPNTVDITPRLQKRTKKNTWTRGRAVAMGTLYRDHEFMEGLTEQDRRICKAIDGDPYGGGWNYDRPTYEFDKDMALPALVGHPLVFMEDDLKTAVEVVQGEPEIRLRKDGDQLVLVMDPMPPYDGYQTAAVRLTPTRLKVVRFSLEHLEMASLLGDEGLCVPASAANTAVEALGALSSLVQVNSDLAVPGTDQGRQIPADPTLHIHIMPFHDGVSVEIWVRPVAETGSYLRPGRGGIHVSAEVEGQKVQTVRDLDKETQLMQELVSRCPTLDLLAPVEDQWQAGDPEQALELLLELKQCQDLAILKWPQGEKIRLASPRSFDKLSLRIQKDRDWFMATGRLDLDEDLTLDLKKLLTLMEKAVGRFVLLDDGTFIALTHQLKERLDELRAFTSSHKQGVRFSPLAGFAVADVVEQAGDLKADAAWKAHCKKLKQTTVPELPGTLQAELRDYQKEGFNWLSRLIHWQVGACLADDMGLGKTLQALAGILLLAGKGPSLVVAPLSVMANWQEECRRFAPTLTPKLFGPGDRQVFLDTLEPFDLVISSYGLLQTEAKRLAGVSWQVAVLDEAQAIKNMKTKRSKAAMGLEATFRLITTGTPVENHLDELWTLFNFITPGLLGPLNRFRETYALPIERDQNKEASRRLRKLIRPFILRRLKTDVLKELPEKTEVTLHVEMSTEEAALYEAQRLRSLENIAAADQDGPGKKHLKILAELTRLRRLCCNPALVLPETSIKSAKLRVFSDTVDELLANRHKALVFSQFVGHLTILRQFLDFRQIAYQYLDGSTPAKERKRRINEFQNGRGDLFLISLKAGGAGLNLTAADYVIHMDPWWNPAVEDQASDRTHRIGQTRPVTVYRLVVKDSIEERIIQLHSEKREMAEKLLAGTDAAGKVSAEELLALLKK